MRLSMHKLVHADVEIINVRMWKKLQSYVVHLLLSRHGHMGRNLEWLPKEIAGTSTCPLVEYPHHCHQEGAGKLRREFSRLDWSSFCVSSRDFLYSFSCKNVTSGFVVNSDPVAVSRSREDVCSPSNYPGPQGGRSCHQLVPSSWIPHLPSSVSAIIT